MAAAACEWRMVRCEGGGSGGSVSSVPTSHQGFLGWNSTSAWRAFDGFSSLSANFSQDKTNKKTPKTVTRWLHLIDTFSSNRFILASTYFPTPKDGFNDAQMHTPHPVMCMTRTKCVVCQDEVKMSVSHAACSSGFTGTGLVTQLKEPWLASVFSCSPPCVSMAIYSERHCFALMMPKEQEAWSKTGSESL